MRLGRAGLGAAVLAVGLIGSAAFAEPARAMPVVGYFTDNDPFNTDPEAPILANGFTPSQITDISTFDLSTVDILMINETTAGPTLALINRLPDIEAFVRAGGVFVIHDAFVAPPGGFQPNPLLVGTGGMETRRRGGFRSRNLDVTPPGGTLVTAGPFGSIDDATLDGADLAAMGQARRADVLAIGGTPILHREGRINQTVAFSYLLDAGAVYYSTVPLDFYLAGSGSGSQQAGFDVYAPNVLAYAESLSLSTPEPRAIVLVVVTIAAIALRRRRWWGSPVVDA